jgi:N-acetylneuraminate synthase
MNKIRIGERWVGEGEPTYFIADIGSNFDGELDRAKLLARLAKESGADAAKFQSFLASKIVSRKGFEDLGGRLSFQSTWKKPVYDVYRDAEFPREWHAELAEYCREIGIDFFSSPYDFEAVDLLESLDVPAFKIGSGDITWPDILRYVAGKKKPVILGTGASTLVEVEQAVKVIRATGNEDLILLQCVTNYPSHFDNANIRAMNTMQTVFDLNVGYSDHTPGSIVPLGAVARGACVIEKHFTDDKKRVGPDHTFAMDAAGFRAMVDSVRILEKALGSRAKDVTSEETETVVLQRRCLRAVRFIPAGEIIKEDVLVALRPAPVDALPPLSLELVVGRAARVDIQKGEAITWDNI